MDANRDQRTAVARTAERRRHSGGSGCAGRDKSDWSGRVRSDWSGRDRSDWSGEISPTGRERSVRLVERDQYDWSGEISLTGWARSARLFGARSARLQSLNSRTADHL